MGKLSDFYKQRAKKHWIQKGDRNTSFFQQAIHKRRKNKIAAILTDNGWTHNPDEIASILLTTSLICSLIVIQNLLNP